MKCKLLLIDYFDLILTIQNVSDAAIHFTTPNQDRINTFVLYNQIDTGRMRDFLGVVLLMFVIQVNAQVAEIEPENWSDGHVTFNNGEQLSGKVYYLETKKTVYFEQEHEMRAMKAAKVKRFDFYDKRQEAMRTFISIPFKRIPTAPEKIEFLEVLRQYDKFLILAYTAYRKSTLPRAKYVQEQTISQTIVHWYLVDEDGAQPLYFSFLPRGLFGPQVEFFNIALFKRIVGDHQQEIDEFAKTNKLKMEKPDDNLKLLDQVEALKKQK